MRSADEWNLGTDIMSRVLTIRDAVALGAIVGAAQSTAKVARNVDSDIIYGTARSIGDKRGAFLADGKDVRDAFLRVTTETGFEAFWPMAELIDDYWHGMFSQYDW